MAGMKIMGILKMEGVESQRPMQRPLCLIQVTSQDCYRNIRILVGISFVL